MTTEITAAGVMPAVLVVRPAPRARTTVAATAVPSAEPVRPREAEPAGLTGPSAPPSAPQTTLCRCGHDAEAHEHYRPGSDCGACGAAQCGRFRALGRRRWPRLRRRRA
jgi:hypothetical protein